MAVTGEVSLSGRIYGVGDIDKKLRPKNREWAERVIIPKANEQEAAAYEPMLEPGDRWRKKMPYWAVGDMQVGLEVPGGLDLNAHLRLDSVCVRLSYLCRACSGGCLTARVRSTSSCVSSVSRMPTLTVPMPILRDPQGAKRLPSGRRGT
jgi:hypothetical protein